MWPSPQPKFKPAVWRFADAKKALDASHNMVPADQTERRNLILVNPIEGNTYATTRHLVAAYQCVMPGDRARTHRHSAAALRLVLHGKRGRLHHRQRRPHRHAAGRGAADAGVVLARPRQRDRRDRLLDRLPRHSRSSSSPRRCSSSRIRRAASRRSPARGPTPMRIPSREALGPGSDAKTVEIAKDVMPTIALNLIRQPKGGTRRDAEDDRQHHLRRGVGQGALHRRRVSTRPPASATSSPCRAGTRTPSRRRRTRWCSRCPTIRSSRSSGSRGRRIEVESIIASWRSLTRPSTS